MYIHTKIEETNSLMNLLKYALHTLLRYFTMSFWSLFRTQKTEEPATPADKPATGTPANVLTSKTLIRDREWLELKLAESAGYDLNAVKDEANYIAEMIFDDIDTDVEDKRLHTGTTRTYPIGVREYYELLAKAVSDGRSYSTGMIERHEPFSRSASNALIYYINLQMPPGMEGHIINKPCEWSVSIQFPLLATHPTSE